MNNINFQCDSAPSLDFSFVNITNSYFSSNSSNSGYFLMKSSSHLRWISSSIMSDPLFESDDNIVDEMWFIEVHVMNQYFNHIPFSSINITFDQYESEYIGVLPYEGLDILGPFNGKRWTPLNGWSILK